nr:hypothetical protein [Homo sapiens]
MTWKGGGGWMAAVTQGPGITWGSLLPSAVRQGEQKCKNTDVSIFLNWGVEGCLLTASKELTVEGPQCIPPLPESLSPLGPPGSQSSEETDPSCFNSCCCFSLWAGPGRGRAEQAPGGLQSQLDLAVSPAGSPADTGEVG